ncbi:uncharacterized protein L199_006109 [Kwoniella botswanensis]|uniref:uncharacterized protein n=1 Tax=Kwoniella botswanensis TaxID=1268659 RepID=UPI00315D461B
MTDQIGSLGRSALLYAGESASPPPYSIVYLTKSQVDLADSCPAPRHRLATDTLFIVEDHHRRCIDTAFLGVERLSQSIRDPENQQLSQEAAAVCRRYDKYRCSLLGFREFHPDRMILNENGHSSIHFKACTRSDSAPTLRELEQRWRCAEKDLVYCKIQKWDQEFRRALKGSIQSTRLATASLRGSMDTAHINEEEKGEEVDSKAIPNNDSIANLDEAGDRLFDDEFRSLLDVDLQKFIEGASTTGQIGQKDTHQAVTTRDHPSVSASNRLDEVYSSLEKAETSYRRLESFLWESEQNLFDPGLLRRYNKILNQDIALWDEWISMREDVSMIRECHSDRSSLSHIT